MVEAAGVELLNRFILCNLQILKGRQNPKIDDSRGHRTVIVQSPGTKSCEAFPRAAISIPHLPAMPGEEFVFPIPFSGVRNLPYFELPDTGNLNQLVQQEVFIVGLLHVLDHRPEPFPLLPPTQTTLAQDDQSRMDPNVEECDEVLRICCDDRKVMIERILPDSLIRATG